MELPKGLHQDGGSLKVYIFQKAKLYGLNIRGRMIIFFRNKG
jgi:hypothetical protein